MNYCFKFQTSLNCIIPAWNAWSEQNVMKVKFFMYKNYETIYNKSLLDPGELKAEVRIEIAKKTAIFI